MKHLKPWAIALAAVLAASGMAAAQEGDAAEERIYLQEEPDWDERQWSVGFGLGLVELGDNVVQGQVITEDDDVETYLALNLRVPLGDRNAHRNYGGRGGFRGFLEPELGYWDGDFGSDLLLGANLVGAMPLNAVEFFVGGGIGVHFIDIDDRMVADGIIIGESDEALGVNAQFGVDINVSPTVGFFAVGRFDLIDDVRDEFEGKAYLGLRYRF